LILRKIIKIIATRCQILRLKCTKIDFGQGSAPDPAGGAYSAPLDPLAGFNGAASWQGGDGSGKGRERDVEGGEEEGRREGGEGEKGKGWRREWEKVTEGMAGTGRSWDRTGREVIGGRGGKRRRGDTAPKLQFLAPPLQLRVRFKAALSKAT